MLAIGSIAPLLAMTVESVSWRVESPEDRLVEWGVVLLRCSRDGSMPRCGSGGDPRRVQEGLALSAQLG